MLRVDDYIVKAIDKANDKFHEAHVDILNIWKNDIVFTWHWWLGVGLTVLPWVFWAVVRKKESTQRLLLAGFAVLIVSSFLDVIGMSMRLWDYSTKVIPLIPPYMPWDFTLLPVTAMLFYQFKPKWNPWIKAAIFSAVGSFLVQPIFEAMEFYEEHGWKDWYTFPVLIGVYFVGYYFITRRHYNAL